MKRTDENIIVQLAAPERKYSKVYHDFLDNNFLSLEEQMIFIVLKSYIDFKSDSGEVFPSIATLCKRAKMSKPRTIKAINALVNKGIVKKVQRGLTKTNVYTLADYEPMWTCEKVEDVAEIVSNQGQKPMTAAEHIAALEKMGYKIEIKENGLDVEPGKVQHQTLQSNKQICKQISTQQNNTEKLTCQGGVCVEVYTMNTIHTLYEYDILVDRHADMQTDIDIVFDLLHETLNTSKDTIRIGGEDKPKDVVISKLLKLDFNDLIYAINKYHEQTERITNVKGYLLTILYNAKEQNYLDLMNRGHCAGDF